MLKYSLIPLGDRDEISIPNLHDSFEAELIAIDMGDGILLKPKKPFLRN